MKTIIIAPNFQAAKYEADRAGVPLHGRDTVLVTRSHNLHGLRITSEDRVIISNAPGRYADGVFESLRIARLTGGSA